MAKSFKEHSKTTWHNLKDDYPGDEEVKIGCLQRIADATEIMAKDREKLIRDYDYMRGQRDRWQERSEYAERRIASLKGVITKLKKAKG